MLTVRSKDCSRYSLAAGGKQSQHRTRAFLAGYCGVKAGGASRDRTGDLVLAKHALSQLSYGPFADMGGGSGRSCTSDLTLIRGAL